MKIVLLGYMGSGKSSIGNVLATKLGVPFSDLDRYIEEMEDRSISNIFAKEGEIGFRKKESFYLSKILDDPKSLVISTGGGTPCFGNNLEIIKKSKKTTSVYLKTSIDELTDRLFYKKTKRPIIAHLNTREQLHDFIRKHIFERSFYYTQADKTVTTDDKSIQRVVEEIDDLLS